MMDFNYHSEHFFTVQILYSKVYRHFEAIERKTEGMKIALLNENLRSELSDDDIKFFEAVSDRLPQKFYLHLTSYEMYNELVIFRDMFSLLYSKNNHILYLYSMIDRLNKILLLLESINNLVLEDTYC